ncbi:response regulator transcription factor [Anaeromicropila populeti]|uniref:Stage 0 sporulation protein A homolog n=1 Tax=Anaeromicropila populeti TaxID=37658 RepID=A0A1I6I9Y0_9FIRM|nr:response regulator transcription factor [Anaeromicropila populeti]SFR63575.1 DNA-binding response regulator, OmpR family, contains REC and winged-helix (wHTH) domain [Anaeromicropila populeti]
MANILIVEDEVPINELVKCNLQLVGHRCHQAFDGNEALDMIKNYKYDLIILDIMLPAVSGFELMKHIENTAVVFLTAKENIEDKIHGFSLGAEDYIVKPFEMLELIARVNVVLRRQQGCTKSFQLDKVQVIFDSHKVYYENELVELTPQEYELLEVLIQNRNIALSREKLLELAWDYSYLGDTRTVDVHVQKLRKKLGWEERIRTVYKLGYRLEV